MKPASFFVAIAATLLVMSGCSGRYDNEESAAQTKEATKSPIAISKLDESPERQFIRTSEMKFRVNDVSAASRSIEDITRKYDGFVTYQHLESNKGAENIVQKSMDSSLESIEYTMTNDITLRIPNTKLDSTLSAIAALVDFIDYKTVKADDVALQIKANQQAQRRAQRTSNAIEDSGNHKTAKLSEITDASIAASDKQEAADNAEISNLSLKDQVAYSRVSLSIYQRTETRFWTIASEDAQNVKAAMGVRIWDAVKKGWYFAQDLFVFLVNMWFLFVLAAVGYWIYRRYGRKTLVKR